MTMSVASEWPGGATMGTDAFPLASVCTGPKSRPSIRMITLLFGFVFTAKLAFPFCLRTKCDLTSGCVKLASVKTAMCGKVFLPGGI